MALLLALTAAWLAPALAQDVLVLHDAEDATAVALRVGAALPEAEAEGRLVRFSDHLATAPPALEGGKLRTCAELFDSDPLMDELERADGALAYLEYDRAARHLRKAEATLLCQSEPVDPVVAAQLYLDQALVALARGERHAAGRALQSAHRFRPSLEWDAEAYPEEGLELYQAARVSAYMQPPAELTVVPDPGEDLWIDGRPAPVVDGVVELPAGEHLAQLGGEAPLTLQLALDSGPSRLVLPAGIPVDALALADEPARRGELDQYLGWSLPAGTRVIVVTEPAVWEHQVGTDQWEDRWAPVVHTAAEARRRVRRGWTVAGVGGGAAVAGGLGAGLAWGAAKRAQGAAEGAADDDLWEAHKNDYNTARAVFYTSVVVAVAGAVGAGTGFAITRTRRFELYPDLVGAGPGLRVTVR